MSAISGRLAGVPDAVAFLPGKPEGVKRREALVRIAAPVARLRTPT